MPNFGNTCKFVEDVPASFWLQRMIRMMGTELQLTKSFCIPSQLRTWEQVHVSSTISSSLCHWDSCQCMQCVALEQSAWGACCTSNIYLVDSTLIGSVQPLCPAILCCKNSGYSTHFAAGPASVKSRISFPSFPLTVAIFRRCCQHLLQDGCVVTAWAPHRHETKQDSAGGCFSQPSVRQPDQIPSDTKRAFLE